MLLLKVPDCQNYLPELLNILPDILLTIFTHPDILLAIFTLLLLLRVPELLELSP